MAVVELLANDVESNNVPSLTVDVDSNVMVDAGGVGASEVAEEEQGGNDADGDEEAGLVS